MSTTARHDPTAPPPPPTMPVPPPPPPPSRDCLLRGAHGEALCVRQLQQTPCPDCPDELPPPTAALPGLTPEQEIRARALAAAVPWVLAHSDRRPTMPLDLAELFAGWIATGQRPEPTTTTTEGDRRA